MTATHTIADAYRPSQPDLAALAIEIHASNVTAGWWSDLRSKESILTTRNRPEMLMLAVSELAEAGEGLDGRPDDKLPHHPMFNVELADFVIRQLDQIGAEVALGATMPRFETSATPPRLTYRSKGEHLMAVVILVARAMEHYRKGRVEDYVEAMGKGVALVIAIAEFHGIDLFGIVAEKRAFNATRADHQAESRLADGGKRF